MTARWAMVAAVVGLLAGAGCSTDAPGDEGASVGGGPTVRTPNAGNGPGGAQAPAGSGDTAVAGPTTSIGTPAVENPAADTTHGH